MARLSREQLEEAVKREVGEKYTVVASDAETDEEAAANTEVVADAAAANINAVMRKYARIFGEDAPDRGEVKRTATAAVLESEDEVAGDVQAPSRRVRVFNEEGQIEAEQG